MKDLGRALSGTFLAIAIIIVGILGYNRAGEIMEHMQQQEQNKAIQECFEISSVTIIDEQKNSTTTDPLRETYKLCVEDKGYDTDYEAEDE